MSQQCDCGGKLLPVNYAVPTTLTEYFCDTCKAYWAVMNSKLQRVPTAGSLADWPELQAHFDSVVVAFMNEIS